MSDRHCRFTHSGLLGPTPQARLKDKTALIVGCGALGSAAALLLMRSGVGKLRLVDFDVVNERNLGDQYLFYESDVAHSLPKVVAAARNLAGVDAKVEIEPICERFDRNNAERLFEGADIAIDGADDVETKYLINDTAIATNTPWIYGGCAGADGTVLAVIPHKTNCLRCIWPAPPASVFEENCWTLGLLPTIPAMLAAIQVTEALKILLNQHDDLVDGPIFADCWEGRVRTLLVPDHSEIGSRCPVCASPNNRPRRPQIIASLRVISSPTASGCQECDQQCHREAAHLTES